jgi:hypothetical protein
MVAAFLAYLKNKKAESARDARNNKMNSGKALFLGVSAWLVWSIMIFIFNQSFDKCML